MTRILITVARGYTDWATMQTVLTQACRRHPDAVLVHGDCPKGDRTAARIWRGLGGVDEPNPADWTAPCRPSCNHGPRRPWADGSTSCPAAGQYRNRAMVASGITETLVFLAPGSHGARSTARMSSARGIPTYTWRLGQGLESEPSYLEPAQEAL